MHNNIHNWDLPIVNLYDTITHVNTTEYTNTTNDATHGTTPVKPQNYYEGAHTHNANP